MVNTFVTALEQILDFEINISCATRVLQHR